MDESFRQQIIADTGVDPLNPGPNLPDWFLALWGGAFITLMVYLAYQWMSGRFQGHDGDSDSEEEPR